MAKVMIGKITSDKMTNTAVVEVEMWKTARIIGKRYRVKNHFLAHNADNQYKLGDAVKIEETRPLSKLKRWRIVELVSLNTNVNVKSKPAKSKVTKKK